VFAKGGEGGTDLAAKVCAAADKPSDFHPIYESELPIKQKIEAIAREIYGADGVTYTTQAEKSIKEIEQLGGEVAGFVFLIELTDYRGSEVLKKYNVHSIYKL
jgi:formate--tetrahydrofolate ligase